MDNKTLRTVLVAAVAVILAVCLFGGGFVAGHFLPLGTQTTQTGQGGTPSDLQTLFVPFWNAWTIIHQKYVDQPVDNVKLVEGAINGMMQSLGDPHSTYMDPQQFQDATTELQGQYAGIGAYVDTNGSLLTVIRPMPGYPAERAGLKAGDQVIAIDGQDVTGLNAEAVRLKVIGEAGTVVTLTIQRPGQDASFDVQITREVITVPSVSGKMLDNNIAYIQITIFGDSTAQDLRAKLGELLAQNPQGLILDLRDNTGGYLDTAISVASEFIPSGVIVYEESGDGTRQTYNAEAGGLATSNSLPMVVLVNGYSASASEIVAGALQDTGRAKLIGETTYGKGSVQNWVALPDNQGAVRITIARWLTPNGRTIDKQGLTPDIIVAMTQSDYTAGRDPQFDQAVKSLIQSFADENNLTVDQVAALLPAYPPSQAGLTYDPGTGFLTAPGGVIAYDLDAANNQWVPYLSEEFVKSLPQGYALAENDNVWVVRSLDGEDLFRWNSVSFAWEAIQVVPPQVTPGPEPVVVSCPLALPARLTVGQSARTLVHLALLSTPGATNDWLLAIPVNTTVEISGGPVCVADGSGAHLWWNVTLPDGSSGWSAEGSFVERIYFLEPIR